LKKIAAKNGEKRKVFDPIAQFTVQSFEIYRKYFILIYLDLFLARLSLASRPPHTGREAPDTMDFSELSTLAIGPGNPATCLRPSYGVRVQTKSVPVQVKSRGPNVITEPSVKLAFAYNVPLPSVLFGYRSPHGPRAPAAFPLK